MDLKEKQFTVRASRRPVEYNYTNEDIHKQNSYDGYRFEYPVNWAADQSKNKVIGIRRISYKPTSVNLSFQLIVDDENFDIDTNITNVIFTDQNSFEECIENIKTNINNGLSDMGLHCLCMTTYDKDKGTFKLEVIDNDNRDKKKDFRIYFLGDDDEYSKTNPERYNNPNYYYYKSEFLKLFNQELNKTNIDKMHDYHNDFHTELTFTNVWNRDSFYCHASFSDSPKQIIGINKDFWQTPSVFYEHSDNSNDFNIYFTTDTKHRIIPRNGVLLLQLSYIFNYQNSILNYS